jgi:hypothetical protein
MKSPEIKKERSSPYRPDPGPMPQQIGKKIVYVHPPVLFLMCELGL